MEKMNKGFQKFLLIFVVLFFFNSVYCANSVSFYFNQGKKLQEQQDWYGAIENYTEVISQNSAYGEAYFKLAECFYAIDEYEIALSYLDSASKYLKNRNDLEDLKGFCYIGLGELVTAEKIFISVLSRFPNDIDARFGLAELNILKGRVSGAEKEYKQALSRQNTNKKALLSLALVSDELNNQNAANDYINQALKYHSGNAEVYYFAAYLAIKQGDLGQAEARISTAIHLKQDYDKAYKLLADILYSSGRYEECIEICKYRIALDRNQSSAWYLRGLASQALNEYENALDYWETGLSITPNDEIMRGAMELLALEITDIEDSRREDWAQYHIEKAAEYQKKFYSVQARHEYRRALRLNPMNTEARLAYAELLLSDGYKESYLSQLQFVVEQGNATQQILDTVEGYNSLLSNTLAVKWNTNPFYLDKKRWNIGLYYSEPTSELFHMDGTKIALAYLEDLFISSNTVKTEAYNSQAMDFSKAFADARKQGYDFFCLVSFSELEREVTSTLTMYSARTGKEAASWTSYRTGNDGFVYSLRYLLQNLESSLPTYGMILNRKNSDILVDIGNKDGMEINNSEWLIVKKDSIKTADFGIGISFLESDVLGTYSVEEIGEDLSSGTIKVKGFYDKINVGDFIIPVTSVTPVQEEPVLEAETNPVKEPLLLQLVRTIRN